MKEEAIDAKSKASEVKNDTLRADPAASRERLLAAIAEMGRATAEQGEAMAEQSKVAGERTVEQYKAMDKRVVDYSKDIKMVTVFSVAVATILLILVIVGARGASLRSASPMVIINYFPVVTAAQAPIEPVAKAGEDRG